MELITAIKKHLLPNIKLWVAIKGTSRLYLTNIVDVYDESFTIYPPMDNGERLIITKKTKLEFMYISNSGKYYFTTKAIDIIKDQITLLAIELPRVIERHEMRAFFRVDLLRHIPVKLRDDIVNEETGTCYCKGEMVTMVCTDISGGGLKLLSPVALRVDDKIDIDLSGIVDGIESVEGTVVRKIGVEEGAYAFGVKFTSLLESERDKIVKRIFQRQVEQAKLND